MERTLWIYTNLGFQLNQLVDAGEKISLEITLERLREKSILEYLIKKFDTKINIDMFTQTEYYDIENTFNTYWLCNLENKLRIKNNGLCLLIAYCLQKVNEIL